MKKLVLILVLNFLGNSINAQYYDWDKDEDIKHHQISLNGSASTWGVLFKINGKLKFDSDSLGYKGHSTPAIQLGYDYFFNENISLGIIGSTQSLNMKVDYFVFQNADDITRRFNSIDINVKRRYIGLRFNYHFINTEMHDLYGGVRFGSVFWKISPSITDTDLDSKLNASFPGTMFPSLAFGYRYKIKERVGIGAELSLGIPQLFSYGVDYRF